jgi:archaemetzincin
MAVVVLPLMSVSEKISKDIASFISNSLNEKVLVDESMISLPDQSYDNERRQYDASKLIRFLKQYAECMDSKILALCNFDIFVEGKNFVYGAAQEGGNICIVSVYRLDPRFYGSASTYETILERAKKEVLHELGHCFGLTHCDDQKCAMHFSEELDSVDEKANELCKTCTAKLEELR